MSAVEDLDRQAFAQEQREARRAAARAFEVVGELPGGGRGVRREVPQIRKGLVEAALANPGKWIRYTPGDLETIKPGSLYDLAKKQAGGFEHEGLNAAVRDKVFYLRFNPEAPK
ncbi:hypothetical protein [Williamsia sp.]|uniref:hypothetical protein n=1 Tax=Williamsia sp. TaxID=1872085 RepID=UPI002F931475